MSNRLRILFLLTGVVALALPVLWIKRAQAQTSCPAGVVVPLGKYHWAQGATVYYSLDSSLDASPGGQQDQIKKGLAAWTTANASNASNVAFLAADQTHPATLTFQANTQQSSVPAGWANNPSLNSSGNIASPITVNIYVNARVSCGTTLTCAIYNPNVAGYDTIFQKVAEHEIGHGMGLDDVAQDATKTCGGQTAGASIMNGIGWANDTTCNALPIQPVPCDNNTVSSEPNYPASPPPPPGTCCASFKSLVRKPRLQLVVSCSGGGPGSPIIIDVSGNGFYLTNAQNGVLFDITGSGKPIQIAWTAPGADNAFLCLPGSDGRCSNGKELFGNFTPQPASSTPNGFTALAVYDGNGDGVIDATDAIFTSLRLWIDANHDGISQPNELYTLPALGVESISLDYRAAQKKDRYGNVFRYRASVNYDNPSSPGSRVAYDVFLVTSPSSPSTVTASNHTSSAVIKHGM